MFFKIQMMRPNDPRQRDIDRIEDRSNAVTRVMARWRPRGLARARVVLVVARANSTRASVDARRGFRSRSIERARGGGARGGGAFGDVLRRGEGARSRPRRIEGGVCARVMTVEEAREARKPIRMMSESEFYADLVRAVRARARRGRWLRY